MERSWTVPCIILVVATLLICLCTLCVIGVVAALGINSFNTINDPYVYPTPTSRTYIGLHPTATPTFPVATPSPVPAASGTPTTVPTETPEVQGQEAFTETLSILQSEIIPTADLLELAERLNGLSNVPVTLEAPAAYAQVGQRQKFWASNTDSNENFQVNATLRYVTDHLYFWIEDSVDFNPTELRKLAEEFENKIYPTNREFFGSEWNPGVDGDPHLYILYASNLGYSVAGYYSSADEYNPLAHEYSNAHEMFMLNADAVDLGEDFTYGVLAHEFQHMIHWYRDRNETSWMNEGFSELAAFLNGYDVGGFDYSFMENPDLQLNDWPGNWDDTTPHYGAGFMYVTYFLDRFGEEATKALVAEAQNGFESVDNILSQLDFTDSLTGEPVTADQFFLDWIIANYLQDESVGDGRFVYSNYASAPQPDSTTTLSTCPADPLFTDVRQYGTDYIRITCEGDHTITFSGSQVANVVPADPHSSDYFFWSNKSDESDMTLTRQFDFTNQSGDITLKYWTWYDLEEDYDYVYLMSSTDGKNWEIITTPTGTGYDPSGNSYGWGYNGSADWTEEEVDLSRFAGQKVYLRFEYITDAAVNAEGFLVDDISIPETGYSEDFEAGDGGWQGDGFVRIQNRLPQTYGLALITIGRETTVQYIQMGADNSVEIPITIGGDVNEVVLVVTGTTRFTRDLAEYRLEVK